jgi:hypothetical protein
MLRKRLRLPRSESARLKQPTATFTKNGIGRKGAQGHEGDGGSLTCGTFDPVCHKQTKAEPEGSPSQGQKRIER